MVTESSASAVADRLWRAYTPYQRGRNTAGDLTAILAILVLARFVQSAGEPTDEFVRRWARAVAEARIDISPLTDLRAALTSASRDPRFPLPDLRVLDIGFLGDDAAADDVPWAIAVLKALDQSPPLAGTGLPEVCELFLERHVQDSTGSGSEFYTPRAVTRLLIDLAAPEPGDRILDPACGSGGLLAAAARRIAESGHIGEASFEAYATDRGNPPLAMMNLAIHGVAQPVVRASDPLSQFLHRGNNLVDRVVGNPPFNQRFADTGTLSWPFGPPPESNANFAWLQLAYTRLSQTGIAGMIMPPRAAWAGGREGEIRGRMVAGGALLGIIALPPNLFPHTTVPVHVWLLARDKSRHLPAGEADAVLFIDASRLGTQAPRQKRVLTDEDVERIGSRLRAWRQSPRTTLDEPGFSRSVTHDEIVENGGSLDPRLYVAAEEERSTAALDIDRLLDELGGHNEATSRTGGELRRLVSRCEQLTRGRAEPPRMPLKDIGVESSEPVQLIAGPSGTLIPAEHYVAAGGVPVVMPKDMTDHEFSMATIRYVTADKAKELERFRVRRGDVLVARRGELGRCAVVRDEQHGWLCGTGCFVVRPPTELDADYFAVYLRSPVARTWLEARSTGGTKMKTISLAVLGELPVVLPDLGTQQAIVALTTQLDGHEQLLRAHLDLTHKIRRGALNQLLTG